MKAANRRGSKVRPEQEAERRHWQRGVALALTCGLHQLRVQAVGDQRFREVSKEGFEGPRSSVDGHVHHHKVNALICRQSTGQRSLIHLRQSLEAASAGLPAQVGLTLIKQLLDVVLVRLVPADAVQTFCGQTCGHKQQEVSGEDHLPASPPPAGTTLRVGPNSGCQATAGGTSRLLSRREERSVFRCPTLRRGLSQRLRHDGEALIRS